MAVLVTTLCWSAESGLKGEAINKVEFSPHHHPGCRFTSLLNHEVAVIKAEVLTVFAKKKWVDSLF